MNIQRTLAMFAIPMLLVACSSENGGAGEESAHPNRGEIGDRLRVRHEVHLDVPIHHWVRSWFSPVNHRGPVTGSLVPIPPREQTITKLTKKAT